MRASLDQFELDEEDLALLDSPPSEDDDAGTRPGLPVLAVVGRPNVGKSSLLNALLGMERAIVTDVPGTTRDVIEEEIIVEGIPLRLLDTAGLRAAEDAFEQVSGYRAPAGLDLREGRLAHPGHPRQLGLREGRVLTCSTHEGRRIVTLKPAHVSMIVHACTIGEAIVGRYEAGVCGRPEVADSGGWMGKKQPD